nr:uncharacterized protein LOC101884517 [Danio rerio]|eukprot:XP_009295414.1 uncharacterized protein LOC101884517 [Danio rerio]
MRTHTLLLHTFALLLLCDYGLFSTLSPSRPPSERSFTETMNISTINITTADSTDLINQTNVQTTDDLESSGLNGSLTSEDFDDTDPTDLSEESEHTTESISSTSRPLSTTRIAAPKNSSPKKGSGNLVVGIIILIFILILIGLLLGVLYFLRKKGRSYSFDLTRVDGPANDYDTPLRSEQQGISYEQTNKDLPVCLDYIQEEKSEEKTMANGCSAEKTEQTPANENGDSNVPEENSFCSSSVSSTPPLKKVEFNLDLDLIGGESDFSNPAASEADNAEQNENNNAARGTAEEIFTEVSLDEPTHFV